MLKSEYTDHTAALCMAQLVAERAARMSTGEMAKFDWKLSAQVAHAAAKALAEVCYPDHLR